MCASPLDDTVGIGAWSWREGEQWEKVEPVYAPRHLAEGALQDALARGEALGLRRELDAVREALRRGEGRP